MGLKTLDGFRDAINLSLGEKRQQNERLDRWVNESVVDLFAKLDLQGRRTCGQTTMVIDQIGYELPTNLVAMLVFRDKTRKRRLIKTSLENFELFRSDTKGDPTHYTRLDRDVRLWPTPNQNNVLRMDYIREPVPLVLGSDTTELPSMYDRIVQLMATRNALLELAESDRATFFFNVVTNELRELPTEEWLESQNPQEGIQIAHNRRDLMDDGRLRFDENFSHGRFLR